MKVQVNKDNKGKEGMKGGWQKAKNEATYYGETAKLIITQITIHILEVQNHIPVSRKSMIVS